MLLPARIFGDDRAREVVAADRALAGCVIDALVRCDARVRIGAHLLENQRRRDRQIACKSRVSDLIVDDLQGLSFARDAEDGADEALATERPHPRGAEHDRRRLERCEGLLAFELAAPIGVERRRPVVLAIRALTGAIEDEIGRVVNEAEFSGPRLFAEHADGLGVETSRGGFVAFGAVDVGVRRGVDDDIVARRGECLAEEVEASDVERGTAVGDDFAEEGERVPELVAELTVRAEEEDAHGDGDGEEEGVLRAGVCVRKRVRGRQWYRPVWPMIRAIAFYLPQFHPIPENDEWWGKGFTEWSNTMRARSLFDGHYQPHMPADLGFYDLRVPEVRAEQARLAKSYGIHGFCYYHYWFSGKRLLERPFHEVLTSGEPDFPFCLCWANENWTRRWDGGEDQILMEQRHTDDNDRAFIQELIPAFRDRRYIRIDGRPVLLVYRTELFPDPHHTVRIWRDECLKAGVGDPYLVRTESRVPGLDPKVHGFDAAYEFPPHNMPHGANVEPQDIFPQREGVDPSFTGTFWQYEVLARGYLALKKPNYKLFRGNLVSWDNTPRRQGRGTVILDASPELYRYWLSKIVEDTRAWHSGDEQLVFINAWNEWAEGCHLEPDRRFGHRWLEATRQALDSASDPLLDEAAAAQNDPKLAAAWIDRAVTRLRERDDALRAALAELAGTDRARLEEIAKRRDERRSGYTLVQRIYRMLDRQRGNVSKDGLPALPRPR